MLYVQKHKSMHVVNGMNDMQPSMYMHGYILLTWWGYYSMLDSIHMEPVVIRCTMVEGHVPRNYSDINIVTYYLKAVPYSESIHIICSEIM